MRRVVIGMLIGLMFCLLGLARYNVGQPVPADVYTAAFEADGIYKFCQTNYGEPNSPRLQAAPDDWIQTFGNNERTLVMYNISELRAIIAVQNRRIAELAAEPNEVKDRIEVENNFESGEPSPLPEPRS